MKDYSELTNRIYTQLSPELSQEFHNMLTEMAQEISRLYEIDNANPSEALESLHKVARKVELADVDDYWEVRNAYSKAENGLLKAQENENKIDNLEYENKRLVNELVEYGKIIEEQHKVLGIIKEKDVDVKLLKLSTNWLDYYTRVKHKTGKNTELTEEEFELLKRWLNE